MSENNVAKTADEYCREPDTSYTEPSIDHQTARTREFKMICNEPKSGKKAKTPNESKKGCKPVFYKVFSPRSESVQLDPAFGPGAPRFQWVPLSPCPVDYTPGYTFTPDPKCSPYFLGGNLPAPYFTQNFESPMLPAYQVPQTPTYPSTATPAYPGTATPVYPGNTTPGYSVFTTPTYTGPSLPAYPGSNLPAYQASSTPACLPAYPGSIPACYTGSTTPGYPVSGAPTYPWGTQPAPVYPEGGYQPVYQYGGQIYSGYSPYQPQDSTGDSFFFDPSVPPPTCTGGPFLAPNPPVSDLTYFYPPYPQLQTYSNTEPPFQFSITPSKNQEMERPDSGLATEASNSSIGNSTAGSTSPVRSRASSPAPSLPAPSGPTSSTPVAAARGRIRSGRIEGATPDIVKSVGVQILKGGAGPGTAVAVGEAGIAGSTGDSQAVQPYTGQDWCGGGVQYVQPVLYNNTLVGNPVYSTQQYGYSPYSAVYSSPYTVQYSTTDGQMYTQQQYTSMQTIYSTPCTENY